MRHDMCEGGSTSNNTETGIPQIPSQPLITEKLDLLGQPENGTKCVETGQPI